MPYDVCGPAFSAIQPYWKIPGTGEFACTFTAGTTPLAGLQRALADKWAADTADDRRSHIRCPQVLFLWLAEA